MENDHSRIGEKNTRARYTSQGSLLFADDLVLMAENVGDHAREETGDKCGVVR